MSEWKPIAEYDALPPKRRPMLAVFFFEGVAPNRGGQGRYSLLPTFELKRHFGSRVCTHYCELPPPPEPATGASQMNARELDILERCFVAEITSALEGGPHVHQTRSKVAKSLADDGFLRENTVVLGGQFPVTITGYELTHAGRFAYCSSARCTEAEEPEPAP